MTGNREDDLHEKATGKGDREADRTWKSEEEEYRRDETVEIVRIKAIINCNLKILHLCVANWLKKIFLINYYWKMLNLLVVS